NWFWFADKTAALAKVAPAYRSDDGSTARPDAVVPETAAARPDLKHDETVDLPDHARRPARNRTVRSGPAAWHIPGDWHGSAPHTRAGGFRQHYALHSAESPAHVNSCD